METFPFQLSAQLALTVEHDHVLVVAEENYVIVNFKDHAMLERVAQNVMPSSKGGGGGGFLSGIEKAKGLNRKLHEAGVVIDVRVNNKTYLELGAASGPKITATAVMGKLGSWFK